MSTNQKKKDNKFYKSGYDLGLKYGSIKEFRELLENETISQMSVADLQADIISVYNNFNVNVLDIFIESDVEKKDLNILLLGYVDGKINYIRNKADKKYHEKVGLVSKSYKLHADVIDAFADACKKSDVSLASTLETLMRKFVNEVDEHENEKLSKQ